MKRLIQTDYSRVGERIFRGVLPNGLRISVIPKPGYTKSFAMFATEYGGADRRFAYGGELINTPAGVAHYLHRIKRRLRCNSADGFNPAFKQQKNLQKNDSLHYHSCNRIALYSIHQI